MNCVNAFVALLITASHRLAPLLTFAYAFAWFITVDLMQLSHSNVLGYTCMQTYVNLFGILSLTSALTRDWLANLTSYFILYNLFWTIVGLRAIKKLFLCMKCICSNYIRFLFNKVFFMPHNIIGKNKRNFQLLKTKKK